MVHSLGNAYLGPPGAGQGSLSTTWDKALSFTALPLPHPTRESIITLHTSSYMKSCQWIYLHDAQLSEVLNYLWKE